MAFTNSTEELDSKPSGGGFFTIDHSIWADLCSVGITEAVAYLVLTQGDSGRTMRSTISLAPYTDTRWDRGCEAIRRLMEAGVSFYSKDCTIRPRFNLIPWYHIDTRYSKKMPLTERRTDLHATLLIGAYRKEELLMHLSTKGQMFGERPTVMPWKIEDEQVFGDTKAWSDPLRRSPSENDEDLLASAVSAARFAPMRRLLSGQDEDYLIRRGLHREASSLRAQHRKLFFRFISMLQEDFGIVHAGRKACMAEHWDFETLLKERFAASYYLWLMRVSGVMHMLRIPQAARVAQAYFDRVQPFISITRDLSVTTR
jgi:hypothetical protein